MLFKDKNKRKNPIRLTEGMGAGQRRGVVGGEDGREKGWGTSVKM